MADDRLNPKVFLSLRIGQRSVGRIVFELFAHVVPKTAENFRGLCTGEYGMSPLSGALLSYKGCSFHRIIKGFMGQSGDFTQGDGTGGESIYGPEFRDESFAMRHDRPGLLSMANHGAHTNGSQFFITFRPLPHLDGKHCVFGKCVEGFELVRLLERVTIGDGDKPLVPVLIEDCGEIEQEPVAALEEAKMPSEEKHSLHDDIQEAVAGTSSVPDLPAPPVVSDEPLGMPEGLTPAKQRLWKIQMRMGQSRVKNYEAAKVEHARVSDPHHDKKRKREEWGKKKEERSAEMKRLGVPEDKWYLFETADSARARDQKRRRKGGNRNDTRGEEEHLQRWYEKKARALPTKPGDGGRSETTEEGIDRVVEDMHASRMKNLKKDRKKGGVNPEADVDYINEKNRKFNERVAKSLGKYSVEIRQNLERGTAL